MDYEPFAITKFQTGQFQYLQPWQSPDDAFDPLINAFVFRGQITKRLGKQLFGLTGRLRYTNNERVATGDGVTTSFHFFLSDFPVEPSSVIVTTLVGTNRIQATDDGASGFIGALAGVGGSIDYTTGEVFFNASSAPDAAAPLMFQYTFSTNSTNATPITLLTEYIDQENDEQTVVANDTRRTAVFNTNTQLFDPVSTFSQILWVSDGINAGQTLDIGWGKTSLPSYSIAPFSVTISYAGGTVQDVPGTYPDGTFTAAGDILAGSSIKYDTGIITLSLNDIPAKGANIYTITGAMQGDYYTGNRSNLFNETNWQVESGIAPAYLYMTNNVDRITTLEKSSPSGVFNLSRLPYSTTQANYDAFINDIATTLSVKVFQGRLLFIRPRLTGKTRPEGQGIRWNNSLDVRNFITDVKGQGGADYITSSDWIESAVFLRDELVVDATNSTYMFVATNVTARPFIFRKINVTKSTNSPYGSVEYDTRTTSMGVKGLCFCDGINKDRYDLEVFDLFEDISVDNFALAQGERFDELQQTWMIYASRERFDTELNCDKVIVYNWLENTWSTYQIPLTCIGLGRTFQDKTWDDFAGLTWDQAFPDTWNLYYSQDLTPWLLGGDKDGLVYFLNQGDFDYSPTALENKEFIVSQIVSKRWNPYVEQGMKSTFGYVDFYYQVNPKVNLTINFYLNNSSEPEVTTMMRLDSVNESHEQYAWKRVFCNITGQFIRLEILSSIDREEQGQFNIAGMILWAKPSGRLTPGTFI